MADPDAQGAGLAAAARVLPHWPELAGGRLTPVSEGLINLTVLVDAPSHARFVLQRLHPVFDATVHLDIEAVTAHLAARGLATPRLVPTQSGALWAEHEGVWRVQTHLRGETVQRVSSPRMAAEAGGLLGRFHAALSDLEHEFSFVRLAHGLSMHVGRLREALAAHPEHRLFDEVRPVAEALLALAEGQPDFGALPRRVTHGDPKITNLLFFPDGRAHALVDLDTLGRQDLPTELGDALRSWCNPAGEDGGPPALDLALFEAAITGYGNAARDLVTPAEAELLVCGLQVICTELACRFAGDALNESYFGWDADRYDTRGQHNLHRARVQLALARSVAERRSEAEAIVARVFGG